MPTTIRFLDGNWNLTDDTSRAVAKLTIVTDDDGNELMRTREAIGTAKGRQTWPTDPRAKAVMQEGRHGEKMSNPQGH